MSDYDPFDLSSIDRDEAARKRTLHLQEMDEVNDIKRLMGTVWGRRIIYRLLTRARIYHSTFNNSGSVTAFQEGQRWMGLYLLNIINRHCPEQYLLMLQESKNVYRNADDRGRNDQSA